MKILKVFVCLSALLASSCSLALALPEDEKLPVLSGNVGLEASVKLTSSEKNELIQILNVNRDWNKLLYTAPANMNAVVQISWPPKGYAKIFYYTHPDHTKCSMIVWGGKYASVQQFSLSVCDRLDEILLAK